MFEFLIDTLEGEPLLCDLENVGACYPDDDVIYMFGIPCRLSSARPTTGAVDLADPLVAEKADKKFFDSLKSEFGELPPSH